MPAPNLKKRALQLPPCNLGGQETQKSVSLPDQVGAKQRSHQSSNILSLDEHMHLKMQLIQHINGVQKFSSSCHPAEQCPLSGWLTQQPLAADPKTLTDIQKLHDLFHNTADVVLGFANRGRKEMAARYVAPGGDFSLLSDSLLSALEQLEKKLMAARPVSPHPADKNSDK